MRLLTQARSHFVRFCNISLIRISQGTTPHCPPLRSHQTGPGPPVRDVITTRLSSDARWPSPASPLASLRTRLAVDAYFSRLCISPWLCLHPPALTCSCKCAGLAGPGCVWKCQKFDGLGANEAKLGWSLCMPSTMLTRVLTPDLVTTMSELKLLLLRETHYTFRLLVINMLGAWHNLVFTQCSRQCLKLHPSYLEISLYGCRKESLNECDTTWAPTNTTPRFCLGAV